MRLEFTYTADDLVEMAKGAPVSEERPRRGEGGLLNAGQRSLLGWILFIALAVGLFLLLENRPKSAPAPPAPPPAPSSSGGVMNVVVMLIPWLLIFGFIWFFVFRRLRKMSPRNVWEQTPSMQQPKTLDISDAGVRLSEPLASTEWRWEAFTALVETKNLLLLRQTDNTFLIIPKRAIPPGQIDSLRFEFNSRIPAPGAFPVLLPKPPSV